MLKHLALSAALLGTAAHADSDVQIVSGKAATTISDVWLIPTTMKCVVISVKDRDGTDLFSMGRDTSVSGHLTVRGKDGATLLDLPAGATLATSKTATCLDQISLKNTFE